MNTKRIYRSRENRKIGGVAAGVADYLNLDPTIVRLGFVVALIFGHIVTLILYVAACLVIPEQPIFD